MRGLSHTEAGEEATGWRIPSIEKCVWSRVVCAAPVRRDTQLFTECTQSGHVVVCSPSGWSGPSLRQEEEEEFQASR